MSLQARRNISGWIFTLPLLLFFGAFYIYPTIDALISSFLGFDYVDYYFVGLGNYKDIFTDPLFYRSIGNTLIYVLLLVAPGTAVALILSIGVNMFGRFNQAFFKAALYLPGVTSIVSLTIVWKYIYDPTFGFMNFVTKSLGLPPQNWLGAGIGYFSTSLIVLTISMGSWVVILTAGLKGIPQTLYEAATIDGAGGLSSFFYITLPLLKPTLLYVIVTATVGAFQVFAIIMLMTGGGPNYRTTTMLMLIYREAFQNMNIGRACAMGIVLSVIVCLVAFFQFKFVGGDDVEY